MLYQTKPHCTGCYKESFVGPHVIPMMERAASVEETFLSGVCIPRHTKETIKFEILFYHHASFPKKGFKRGNTWALVLFLSDIRARDCYTYIINITGLS